MSTLGLAILLGSIHASIVAAATIVARFCFPRRLAAGRVTIGLVGLVCILIVTALAFAPIPGVWPESGLSLASDLSSARRADKTDVEDRVAIDAEREATQSSGVPADAAETSVQVPLAWLRRIERTATRSVPFSHRARVAAVTILAGGSVFGLLRLMLAVRFVARLRRTSSLVTDESITVLLRELANRCGCRQKIEVRATAQQVSASAFGWLRPVILLPSDWVEWSQEELAAVLAHEVAHVHRGDYARRVATFIGVAIHFYHPLVRSVARRLAADQEYAADQLARDLVDDAQAYTRGLARLALRYHESIIDERSWSNVSIMPRSSDFLARRLEMLRVKQATADEQGAGRVSLAVSGCVVAIAIVTAFLRGAATADDRAQSAATIGKAVQPISTENAATIAGGAPGTEQSLFERADFNPTVIGLGSSGGFLIRVGDFLRHPEVQPHVESINGWLRVWLRDLIGEAAATFDIREIEWIAGDLIIKARPSRDPMRNGELTLGSNRIVIRTAHFGNWRQVVLDEIPGTTLEHFEGKPYVQFPSLPAFGPAPLRMRTPDPRTLIYRVGTIPDPQEPGDEEKLLRKFFDDTPNPCPWASAWRAVDGGLVTVLFDNSAVGWPELAAAREDHPELIEPLARKTKFVALGADWTDLGNRTGVRVRATCEDADSVREIHLASMTLLSFWPGLVLEGGDAMAPYQKRILQFFSSVKVQPSVDGSEAHFVHATAEVTWDPHEFAKALGLSSTWLLDPTE
ncbi:MAG TPA: M56 family metallopeptidase [Pirellulales bacterium]|jgi:beta-lactamase regulating signal transducer with metallopeptidase domain